MTKYCENCDKLVEKLADGYFCKDCLGLDFCTNCDTLAYRIKRKKCDKCGFREIVISDRGQQ